MKNRKEIISLSVPAMLENILQILMGVVDNYLVSQIGLIAVSGVSVANNIIVIYQALFIAIGSAVSSLVAKSRGSEDTKRYHRYVSDSVLLTVVISLILGILTLMFAESFLTWLGTDSKVSLAGASYLKLVGGTTFSMGLMTTFGAILRANGHPKLPMYVSFGVNILNAILASFMIYLFHLGVVGVALATVFSRLVAVCLLARKLPMLKIIKNTTFRISSELLSLVLPSAGERLMMRAGDVVIVAVIVGLGTKVVAGNAIGETLTQFNYMPGMAVATATVILVAQSIGQRERDKIDDLIKDSYLIASTTMFLMALLVFLNGYFLSSQFSSDKLAIQSSCTVLLYSMICGPFTAGTLIYTAVWQGIGNARLPFYATTFGMWGIRIIVGYLLTVVFKMGLSGVWIATIIDNAFRFLFLKSLFQKNKKRSK